MGGGVPQRALPSPSAGAGAPSPQQLLHSGKRSPDLMERNPIPLRSQPKSGSAFGTAFGSSVPTVRERLRSPSPSRLNEIASRGAAYGLDGKRVAGEFLLCTVTVHPSESC